MADYAHLESTTFQERPQMTSHMEGQLMPDGPDRRSVA